EDGIRDFHVTGVQTCALPILGIKILSGRYRHLVEEGTNLRSNFFKKSRALFSCCLLRISHSCIARHGRPATFRPSPSFAHSREGKLLCLSVSCLRERQHQVRRQVKHDAGLHLAGMIVTVLKELRLIHGVKPVTRAEKHFWIVQSKLADHSLEIVSTVAVQDDQLMYALSVQHLDDVVQHLRLCRW